MVTKEQISLKEGRYFLNAAYTQSILCRKIVRAVLKTSSIFGFISLVIIILEQISGFSLGYFSLLPRLFFMIGLTSFPVFIFINRYYRELEDSNVLAESSNYEIFKVCDFELARILGVTNTKDPDLSKILDRLIHSSRTIFIMNEMNAGVEIKQEILDGLTKDNQEFLLLEILAISVQNALEEKSEYLSAGDLFFGFLKKSTNFDQIIMKLELTEDDLRSIIFWGDRVFEKVFRPKTLLEKMKSSGAGMAQNWSSGYTLNLDRFSQDISRPEYFGNFSIEGRENIVSQVENILSKETKNNCILTGEDGSGKTTLAYGLAEKIYWGDTLPELSFKRLVKLDVGVLIAGATNERAVEERLIGVLNDAVRAGNVILMIDEIHTLFSGGQGIGSIDASEIIVPYLQNSPLRVIGTTTNNNYQTYISPKSQISSNFEKVNVPNMDEYQTLRILEDLSIYYSRKYRVHITYSALKEIYRLADRFITNKGFPAKAVDMLDNICSGARNQGVGTLDKKAADAIAGKILNVPVEEAGDNERQKLLKLEEEIHKRVIGQDEAVKAVSDALRRARATTADKKRPIGSFLFLGPTGVGKTELTKALAASYFGDENAMIRMDMSEFQEISSIERFIGKKSPGTDQLEGGDFVKKVQENPFSVVLLDEVEKAHPNILNLFLQILDEGNITDGMGNKIIFANSIIIATSNAGANLLRDGISANKDMAVLKDEVMKYLQDQNIYRPEFLNRFDGVILFKPLTKENLMCIAKLMFDSIKSSYKEKGYIINIDPEALVSLMEQGYKPELGARPMRRIFQDKLESFLANKVLDGTVQKGISFVVKVQDLADSPANK